MKYDRIGITSEMAKDLTTTNHKNYEVEAQKGREKRVKSQFSQQNKNNELERSTLTREKQPSMFYPINLANNLFRTNSVQNVVFNQAYVTTT